MSAERYELSWKEFDQCTSQSFRNHYNKDVFSDVTLATDDDKQIKSHKMILSACSPFFQKILLANPHQHPLIYLKGVKSESLQLILRFMYLGETKVAEAELQSFLDAAEELKVLGLSDSSQFRRDLGLADAGPPQQQQAYQAQTAANLPTYDQSTYDQFAAEPKPNVNQLGMNPQVNMNAGSRYISPSTSNIALSGIKTYARQPRKDNGQPKQVIKKETNTVRCNLCQQLIVNNEKNLLDHVQRVHGA